MAKCAPGCTCGRHRRADHVILRKNGKSLCPRCERWVDDEDWYVRRGGSRASWCRSCHQRDGRERRLRTLFSLSEADYEVMLKHQDGRCAICRKLPKNVRLAVDHDHKTGQVRGLLCWACNSGIGKWNDDPKLLSRASDYLVSLPATGALGREVFGRPGRVSKIRRRKRAKRR